jgi:hypothetical protein
MLSNYLTYASLSNLIMMSKTFIIPAVLDQCLDYFGFYGDMMSREFLRHIQKIDGDIVGF